ncbi:hypothetical protein D7B24_003022 [Verticillium nonalfalfae]|uniref:FAS1 domain-containing protein n=1 Tax=Verticillium nonalfalfae TaxID=1051616 RepID=A0A3M9YHL0_9PEZI|nr:uncharacterized protein D7B24_003022 [Verticillium nonalfalfae]RNJ59266.1 hypothetical protein D7B24_003022 [Verticillium nonalfalfae]
MKFISTLPFAAIAAGIVVPSTNDLKDWQDFLPTKKSIASTVDSIKEDARHLASNVEDAVSYAGNKLDSFASSIEQAFEEEASTFGGHHHHHPDTSNLTIYELISKSDYATKFFHLVNEHESLVKLLNSTKANYTVFVPTDEAFEHIPDHHDKKPSKEFVEGLLKYHVGLGLYPAGRILATHTIPTALNEPWLGDRPQRLRTRVGLTGVRVNFYDKVVAANIFAKNGVAHAVNRILVPPPFVGRELSLFPSKFSTLLLAYEKTHFTDFIHHVEMKGATVFAPSNTAFDRLGPGANAFLFNSEKGLKYLKALLKYHVVANETLYSDHYYKHDQGEEEEVAGDGNGSVEAEGIKHYHVDLPSLLDEKSIAVDITRWGGFIDLKVNGYIHVSVSDAVAKNGVVHVVDSVLLPHRKPGGDAELDVEELKAMLAPFVEEAEDDWNEL